MAEHLVFTLTAALGAMGEFAGHERRGTTGWPARSAVLGLVAAALGIRRDDPMRLAALEPLKLAVAIFDEGLPLRDYHTVETVPTAQAKRPDSRRSALREAGLKTNTMVTLRDYRTGPLFGVALWSGVQLEPLAAALRRPVFTLYLGRKSCPLAAPLAPVIIDAEGPIAALSAVRLPPWRQGAIARRVASDRAKGLADNHVEIRNDAVLDREHWHFAQREVLMLAAAIAPQTGGME